MDGMLSWFGPSIGWDAWTSSHISLKLTWDPKTCQIWSIDQEIKTRTKLRFHLTQALNDPTALPCNRSKIRPVIRWESLRIQHVPRIGTWQANQTMPTENATSWIALNIVGPLLQHLPHLFLNYLHWTAGEGRGYQNRWRDYCLLSLSLSQFDSKPKMSAPRL